jgi:hypothetical protein
MEAKGQPFAIFNPLFAKSNGCNLFSCLKTVGSDVGTRAKLGSSHRGKELMAGAL